MELNDFYGNEFPDVKPGFIFDSIERKIMHSEAAPCQNTAVEIKEFFLEYDSLLKMASNSKYEMDYVWQKEFENYEEKHSFLLRYTGSYSSKITESDSECVTMGTVVEVIHEKSIAILICSSKKDSREICSKFLNKMIEGSNTVLDVETISSCKKSFIFDGHTMASRNERSFDSVTLCLKEVARIIKEMKSLANLNVKLFKFSIKNMKEAKEIKQKESPFYNMKVFQSSDDKELDNGCQTRYSFGNSLNNANVIGKSSTYNAGNTKSIDKVTTDIEHSSFAATIKETNVDSTVNMELRNSENVTKRVVLDLHKTVNKNIPRTLNTNKYDKYTDKAKNLDSNIDRPTEDLSKPSFSAVNATKEFIVKCSSSEKSTFDISSVAIIKETNNLSKEINEPGECVLIDNITEREIFLPQLTTDDQSCLYNKASDNKDDCKSNTIMVSKLNTELINQVIQPIPTKRTTVPSCKSFCQTVTNVNNELLNNVSQPTPIKDTAVMDVKVSNGCNSSPEYALNKLSANKIVKRKHITYRCIQIPLTASEFNGFKTVEIGSKKEATEKPKTILLLGATGSGKTALLNMIANFYFGAQSAEEEKLFIDESKAKTDRVTVYTFYPERENQLPITVIDTPGLNDSTGAEIHDHVDALKSFLAVACSHGLEIHAIGFVAQAHLVRLTSSEKLVMDYVTSIFGADVKKHIMALVTFSDNQPTPPVVEAMEKFGLESPFFVKFNNTLLISRSGDVDELDKIYWRTGLRSWKKCLKFLKELSPLSTAAISSVQSEVFNKSVLSKCSEVLRSEISTLIMLSSGKKDLGELYSQDLRKQRTKVWLASNVAYNLEETAPEESKEIFLLKVCQDQLQRISCDLSSALLLFILLDGESVMRDVVLTIIKSLANFNDFFDSMQLFDNRQKRLIARCLNCKKDCYFKKTWSYNNTKLVCSCFCDGGMHGPSSSERQSLPNLPILRLRFIRSTMQSLIDTISQYKISNVEWPVRMVFNHLLHNELGDSKRLIRNICPIWLALLKSN